MCGGQRTTFGSQLSHHGGSGDITQMVMLGTNTFTHPSPWLSTLLLLLFFIKSLSLKLEHVVAGSGGTCL